MDPRRLLPALTAVACACVVLTLGVGWARTAADRPRPADESPGTASAGAPTAGGASAAASASRYPAPPGDGPAAVLAGWDRERARAWAEGDVSVLRSLYADGSRAGAADVGLLRAWLARGLRVEGMAAQVLALEVVDRGRRRLVLRVTDRVVGARAVGAGVRPRPLPVGRPVEREVELRREAGEWRVVEATSR